MNEIEKIEIDKLESMEKEYYRSEEIDYRESDENVEEHFKKINDFIDKLEKEKSVFYKKYKTVLEKRLREQKISESLEESEIYDLLEKAHDLVKEKDILYPLYKKYRDEEGSHPCFDYIKKIVEECFYGKELDKDSSFLKSKEVFDSKENRELREKINAVLYDPVKFGALDYDDLYNLIKKSEEVINELKNSFENKPITDTDNKLISVTAEANDVPTIRQTFVLEFIDKPLNEIPSWVVRSVSLPPLNNTGYSYISVCDTPSDESGKPLVFEKLKNAIQNGSRFSYKIEFYNEKGKVINTLFVEDDSDENNILEVGFLKELDYSSNNPIEYYIRFPSKINFNSF